MSLLSLAGLKVLLIPLLITGCASAQEIVLKNLSDRHEEFWQQYFTVQVDDVDGGELVDALRAETGYEILVEEVAYIGAGNTLTLTAARINAMDLLALIGHHMAPQREPVCDFAKKTIHFNIARADDAHAR